MDIANAMLFLVSICESFFGLGEYSHSRLLSCDDEPVVHELVAWNGVEHGVPRAGIE